MFGLFVLNDTATTEIYTNLTHSFPTRRSAGLAHRGCGRSSWAPACRRGRAPCSSSWGWWSASVRACSSPSAPTDAPPWRRSEEHTSELQSLMRISYAVFCLKKKMHLDRERNIIPLKFQHH